MATRCRHCTLDVVEHPVLGWVHRVSRLVLCRPLAPASERAEPEAVAP